MNAYGIQFINRVKDEALWQAARNEMQFTLFAALCGLAGVDRYIPSVIYDHHTCSFCIEVPPEVESMGAGSKIFDCAAVTFSCFELFGFSYDQYGPEGGL